MDELGPTTRVMHAMEQLWAEIRRRHPDVPDAILVLASGTMGTTTEIHGHFARSRWHVGAGREPRAEFFLGAEGLRRPAAAILGTTLHEAAHGLAATRDIVDVSDGRYHNKKFAALARELGVEAEPAERIGWSVTTALPETVASYRARLAVLENALKIWRHTETEVAQRAQGRTEPSPGDHGEPVPPAPVNVAPVDGRGAHRGGANYFAAVCRCAKPRRIRAALSVFDLGEITCGVCGEAFSVVGSQILPRSGE
ncbi:hypothetical protein [Amycolatopsis sp. PS_44_ISF1]|uniref:hypothetical protein n=1 Tax=Amycolatopsis sp. PS_44_ISF1 TaxID=2974917 RepID=UPI0028E09BE5|nr:hypothetical protein [Amycolatopsis sp. PS_44_ISF1]MDT8912776.1 hypothetical protein [Amycolatopsis sp. PS_44_ISF1]